MEPKIKIISEIDDVVSSRLITIDIKGFRRVEAPSRIATRKYIESKKYGPTNATLDNDIVIADYPIYLRKGTDKEQGLNQFFQRRLLDLERLFGELYHYHYVIPYFYPSGEMRGILKSPEKFYELYADVMTLAFTAPESIEAYDINSIMVPPAEIPLSDYKETLRKITKELETYGIQAIPVIDLELSVPAFREILQYLTDNLNLKVIGLKYRKVRTKLGNYLTLKKNYLDKDVLFIMVDIPREESSALISDFAIAHLMVLVGIDMVTTVLKRPPGIMEQAPKLRLMNRKELRLPLIMELERDQILELFDDAEITKEDPKVGDIVNVLANRELLINEMRHINKLLESSESKDKRLAYEKSKRLKGLTDFQEIKASTKEFMHVKEAIKRNELKEYLQQRTNLIKAYKTIVMRGKKLK